jgi:hypothetical protein
MCVSIHGPLETHMSALFSTVGLLATLAFSTAPAHANEGIQPEFLAPEALTGAEKPAVLTRREIHQLEPKRRRLPNNPYTHTDFTAYSLEFGEMRVGVGQIKAGIAPRTQIGTIPAALAVGALNGTAKIDFLRLGPVDVAATGAYYQYTRDQFTANHSQVGGTTSLRIRPVWSMHVSSRYQTTRAQGVPDLNQSPWLVDRFAADLEEQANTIEAAGGPTQEEALGRVQANYSDDYLEARSVNLKVATDIRMNRRDSFIIQASANLWSSFESTMDIESLAAEDRFASMALDSLQAEGVMNTYVTSAAWHFSWHRADLRLGVGLSSVPGAWLTQTADFAWRLGGTTRRSESRMTRTWKHNRRDLRRASYRNAPAPDAT